MKKLFSLLIALSFLFAGSTFGQDATVTIPHDFYDSGTILVPVEVDFSSADVCGFQFIIDFDGDYLTYEEVLIEEDDIDIGGNWYIGPATTTIQISWLAEIQNSTIIHTNYNGVLLHLVFKDYDGGNTDITFNLDGSAVSDCSGEDYNDVEFNNGSVTEAPPAVPLSIWAVISALGLIAAFVIVKRGRFF